MKQTISASEIYEKLKSDIVNLNFLPSTRLSENEISKEYGVSRTPVKAAFTRLENEGFLTVLPQRGSYVSLLDLEKIKEFIYMRYILECDISKKFIEICTDFDLKELEHLISLQKNILTKENFAPADFYNLDVAFHGYIFGRSGHKILWEELLKLQVNYTRFRMLDIVTTEKFEMLIFEHEALLSVIKTKNITNYNKKLDEHLSGNLKKLEKILDTELTKYFI